MKKYLFMLAALVMGLAACTTDPTPDGPKTDGDKVADAPGTTTFIQLAAEGHRFVTSSGVTIAPEEEEDGDVDTNNGAWFTAPDHLSSVTGNEEIALTSGYSATGIAFSEDGDYIYVSWHSNRAQDKNVNDDEDEWHNHGTNVVEETDEDGETIYNEPSLKDADDWGGIIDVIKVGETLDAYEFVCSYWQPEHKYNHVAYKDNKLYLASTSWYVGAALHEVPLITEDGDKKGHIQNGDAVRYNLTGNSANCVAFVGNDVVTVSGRTLGGVNWFNVDKVVDEYKTDKTAFNLTSKSLNETHEAFGGKHIYYDGTDVYVLRDPKNPVIEKYTNGTLDESFKVELKGFDDEDFGLKPIDGKNVLTGDDNYLYACCGYYGLQVISKSTKEVVAVSAKIDRHADNKYAQPWNKYYTANGVDVDNKYIYVANGAGLLVFSKDFTKNDNVNETSTVKILTLKKYAKFTGTINFEDFEDFDGNQKTQEGEIKESSNFVVVKTFGDKHYAFVAYGMYGLRIYDLAEFYPAEEPEVEVPEE